MYRKTFLTKNIVCVQANIPRDLQENLYAITDSARVKMAPRMYLIRQTHLSYLS
jgi:hypothetical protein